MFQYAFEFSNALHPSILHPFGSRVFISLTSIDYDDTPPRSTARQHILDADDRAVHGRNFVLLDTGGVCYGCCSRRGHMVTGLSGYRMGAAKLAGLFGGAAAAIAYAPAWGKMCEPMVAELLGTTGLMTRTVSTGTIGIGIMVAAMIALTITRRALLEYNPFQRVPQLDRMQESIKLARDPQKLNQLLDEPDFVGEISKVLAELEVAR